MIPLSTRTVEYLRKPSYTPAATIQAPDIPEFRRMMKEDGPPIASAPRQCQLCGEGFMDFEHLVKHCEHKHGNWSEYRKRLFYEADLHMAQSLPKQRKRQQLANFTYHLTHSIPGDGEPPEPRRQEACAVCARKGWLEARYRVYLFRPWTNQSTHTESCEDDEEQEVKDDEEKEDDNVDKKEQRRRRLRRDQEGKYYFGDPAKVNKILSVDNYHEAFPQIPVEELHASSVQHPQFLQYKWLLHTKRVPVMPREKAEQLRQSAADVAQDQRPPSDAAAETIRQAHITAGVGDAESTCWLCRECRDSLCHEKHINMQGPALANYMWGGREHPLYQGLSDAMRMLLGRGRPYYCKSGDHAPGETSGSLWRRVIRRD